MKSINIVVDFEDTDEGTMDREDMLYDLEVSLGSKRSKKLVQIRTHDCYHDEGKPCKNLEVVHDDISKEL